MGDADAGRGEDLLLLEEDGGRDRLLHPLGHLKDSLVEADIVEQNGELVTTVAGHGVARPHTLL